MQPLLDTIATLTPNPTEAHRIFHGRGGLHPGCEHLALDAFPPVWLLTSFSQPLSEVELAEIHSALSARCGPTLSWAYQFRHEGRSETRLMAGSLPEPQHIVSEQGARYLVHLLRGQNHGLFLDMAEGRRWVRECVAGWPDKRRLKVLNLFAYTCAFSVVALQAGATQVVNVDMSDGALAIGKKNHQLNGLTAAPGMGTASFLPHDIFSSWGKIGRAGPYELIIVDPPSFQKGSFVATKDYARLMRRLPELLVPGGRALLCLNTPKLDLGFLQAQMQELAPTLRFVERVANPAAFADVDEQRSLKVLVYQAPALG
ncbi:class I SAM-dependent methyltransferase [Paucibacter sp. M5-1]|uniref:class I SAM-dependent methyltransferase n=1 Tax=Paucibacter sp. M5-1 TaxID=3015998 RepID=UPI0022B917CB|nr:class I SAM-dependent methyltransferase [Paucibacter sp. M5-1]MCZ7880341.1 class I SAM-dependent methyltransferase [Paucibacter sp. M5-1]